jgi:hypothetical protein
VFNQDPECGLALLHECFLTVYLEQHRLERANAFDTVG